MIAIKQQLLRETEYQVIQFLKQIENRVRYQIHEQLWDKVYKSRLEYDRCLRNFK